MYDFCYDYWKPRCSEKVSCVLWIQTGLLLKVRTDDIYKDIADDVEKIFDFSNYDVDRPMLMQKIKKLSE